MTTTNQIAPHTTADVLKSDEETAQKTVKPRLHDTTCCQTGCQTRLTTRLLDRLDNRFDNRLYRVKGYK